MFKDEKFARAVRRATCVAQYGAELRRDANAEMLDEVFLGDIDKRRHGRIAHDLWQNGLLTAYTSYVMID